MKKLFTQLPIRSILILIILGLSNSSLYSAIMLQNLTFELLSSSPSANSKSISRDTKITLAFNNNVDGESIDSWGVRTVGVFGKKGGTIRGSWTGMGTKTIEFTPNHPFMANDVITVEIRQQLLDDNMISATPTKFSFQVGSKGEISKWQKSHLSFATSIDGPRKLKSIDIDGDGDLDLVIASRYDNTIRWMENDGTATFTEHIISTNAKDALDVEAGDFDLENNGRVDILAGSSVDKTVRWFRNTGDEVFSPNVLISNADQFRDLAFGDIDNDGDNDVIVTSVGDDRVRLLKNNGFLEFTASTIIGSLNNPNSITLADINGDSFLDIVITSYNDNDVTLLQNKKDGTFETILIDGNASGPIYSTVADLNSQKEGLEIVVASYVGNAMFYYEFDGAKWNKNVLDDNLTTSQSVQLVDLNSDGIIDILASASTPGRIFSYMNSDFGVFSYRELLVDSTMKTISHFEYGDFNNDGYNDLVVADVDADSVYLFTAIVKTNLISSMPLRNASNVETASTIEMEFDSELAAETVSEETIHIWAEYSGKMDGSFTIESNKISFNPSVSLPEGEVIHVYVSENVKNKLNESIQVESFSFTTAMETDPDLLNLNWNLIPDTRPVIFTDLVYAKGLYVGVYGSGASDQILISSDLKTWEKKSAPAANSWSTIAYGNDVFVVLGKDGDQRAMYSSDGNDWTLATMPSNEEWEEIIFAQNRFVAISSTGDNRAAYSFDGMMWYNANAPFARSWEHLTYGNGLFVAVSPGGLDNIMISKNGIQWETIETTSNADWNDISYGNGLFTAVGTASNNGPSVMTSTDGLTWNSMDLTSSNVWTSITFFKGEFLAMSFTGSNRLMKSKNGMDWSNSANQDSVNWFNVYVIGDRLLSRSSYGLIVTEGLATSAEHDELISQQPSQLSLNQNYPNPFNPSTKIQYGLNQSGKVRLEVFDFLGRKINVLVSENQSAGWYEVDFNASQLSSGVYMYRLTQNGSSKMGKMLLIK